MELLGFFQRLMGHSKNGHEPKRDHWTGGADICEGSRGRVVYKKADGTGTCPICKDKTLRVTRDGRSWRHRNKNITRPVVGSGQE